MPFSGEVLKLNVRMTQDEIKGLYDPKTFATMVNEDILRQATKFMAFGSMTGLAWLLWPGNIVDGVRVGASGMSSKNIEVAELASGLAGPAHAVYEGTKTPANQFIRTGTAARGKKGKNPPLDNIKEWIMTKGFSSFALKRKPPKRNPNQLASGPNQVTHIGTPSRSPLDDLAWAISGSIKKYGTSRGHKSLYPGNQKRFDYVGYAVVRKKMVQKLYSVMAQTQMPMINRLMVHYMKTGSRQRTSWGSKRVRVL
jgi:hypothetical protein